jgi:hypothetical protein
MPKRFSHPPSRRKQPGPVAKWLVTGTRAAGEIARGDRTVHAIPVRAQDHPRRYNEGRVLLVKSYVGGRTEARVNVHDASRVRLDTVGFDLARELGARNVDHFKESWVLEHDEYDGDDLIGRFDGRWAGREVWIVRFSVDRTLPPRLLASKSEELYVESQARAMPDELPALSEDEWRTHVHEPSRKRAEARLDDQAKLRREAGLYPRIVSAKAQARLKGYDVRDEVRRLDRLIVQGRVDAVVRQLELLEARVYPRAA